MQASGVDQSGKDSENILDRQKYHIGFKADAMTIRSQTSVDLCEVKERSLVGCFEQLKLLELTIMVLQVDWQHC